MISKGEFVQQLSAKKETDWAQKVREHIRYCKEHPDDKERYCTPVEEIEDESSAPLNAHGEPVGSRCGDLDDNSSTYMDAMPNYDTLLKAYLAGRQYAALNAGKPRDAALLRDVKMQYPSKLGDRDGKMMYRMCWFPEDPDVRDKFISGNAGEAWKEFPSTWVEESAFRDNAQLRQFAEEMSKVREKYVGEVEDEQYGKEAPFWFGEDLENEPSPPPTRRPRPSQARRRSAASAASARSMQTEQAAAEL